LLAEIAYPAAMHSWRWGLVLIAALAGCGGDGTGSAGGAVLLDQLDEEYAAAFCRKLFACCTAAELTETPAGSGDEAACRATYGARIAPDLDALRTGVASGVVSYDGAKARSCFDTLVALPCTEWGGDDALERIPDCALMLRGTVAPGGACLASRQCLDGECGSGGICVANARPAEPCVGKSCQGGLYCDTDPSGALTTCAAYQPNGAPCSFNDECRSNSCGAVTPGVCGPSEICNGI
jgi:hypothetical protein